MSSSLTIVIPTKNRNKYLKRTINYWSDTNCKIIIADGSSKADENLKKNKKILYFHSNKSIHERIIELIHLVKTKYVLFSGDDEFFSKQNTLKYINFLNKNKQYIACGGNALSFDVIANSCFYKLSYSKKLTKINIDNFSNYSVNYFYSINRTKFWKKNLETAIKIDEKYKIFSIGEMIFEYLMLLDGKVFKFNDIFWYRSMENSPIPASKIKFSIWWEKLKIIEKNNFVFEIFAKKTIIKKTIKIFDKLSYFLKTKKIEKPSLLRRVIFKLFNITYVKMHNKNQILNIIKNNKILINLEELELIENYIAK
jgi:glycosyltransferase domain-containing protein